MLLQYKVGVSMTLNKMLRALVLGFAAFLCTAPSQQTVAPANEAIAVSQGESETIEGLSGLFQRRPWGRGDVLALLVCDAAVAHPSPAFKRRVLTTAMPPWSTV